LAELEEMRALKKNGIWEVVDLPRDKKIVGCKRAFMMKCRAERRVERYMVTLVVNDFTQIQRINYQETFAPVPKINPIQVLLPLSVNSNWLLHQLDVKNAFHSWELGEEVFVSLPLWFEGKHRAKKVC
jgi:hypothetical protein